MDQQYAEIAEIPAKAAGFWEHTRAYDLPLRVPYLGMGSSYFAPLAFKYMGVDIYPEMASEFFHYLFTGKKLSEAVILSQSGRSTEALWCRDCFSQYTAISNYTASALCTAPNVVSVIDLLAGDEQYSSSKTYINTLLALFKGFGFNAKAAIDLLTRQMPVYEEKGKQMAAAIYELITAKNIHGIYIIGSGPNIATAMQAALIMSESTKLSFTGMPMAQYDHGPKETAANSIVIQIMAKGKSYNRSLQLADKIAAAGATVFTMEEPLAEEHFSVLHNSVPFNFMAWYLAKQSGIGETFTVGGKITEVV